MHYYVTKETKKFLSQKIKRVYLFGSNTGHANFGDIIQLKNEIKFHKVTTRHEPVIFMRLDAPYGGLKYRQNQVWYDTKHFVYISSEDRGSKTPDGLYRVEQIEPGSPLHIYGGGFLNSFWGKEMVDAIERILRDFSVGDYIFSGQQVGEAAIPELRRLFTYKIPILFGLRDKQSLKYMEKDIPEVTSVFSFDDVTETLLGWVGDSREQRQGLRKGEGTDIAWHFNTTSYTAGDLSTIYDKMTAVQKKYPHHSHTIMQAFNDRERAKDSLQTIVDMENDFPLNGYAVINIGKMALEMNVNKGKYPDLGSLLSTTQLAVTSSYHTAMMMNYFGIPAYLMAANEYYLQKQKGLGYVTDFNKFLRQPAINLKSFQEERVEREAWRGRLASLFETI